MTPRCLGHRGVLTHKVLRSLHFPVLRTPASLNSPVLKTPGSLDSPALRTLLDFQRVKYCNSPVLRTPGSLDSPVLRTPGSLDSLVLRTPGSLHSLVHRTPGSLDSPVHRTPRSHLKMLITQLKSKKNQNCPRTSPIGPGGAVDLKNQHQKNVMRLSLS